MAVLAVVSAMTVTFSSQFCTVHILTSPEDLVFAALRRRSQSLNWISSLPLLKKCPWKRMTTTKTKMSFFLMNLEMVISNFNLFFLINLEMVIAISLKCKKVVILDSLFFGLLFCDWTEMDSTECVHVVSVFSSKGGWIGHLLPVSSPLLSSSKNQTKP